MKQQAAMFKTAGGCAKRSRAWAVQTSSPDKVLHYSEATGGHAGTAGGWAAMLCHPPPAGG
ncbi:MAG: hypothetical protein LBD24_01365 [Spirochaetaceae bacterium]|nr:hypothetical protein [Spirochaetaceae bacterium]